MAITALPTPPSRSDPTNFATQADAFLGALPTFQAEANALQTDVNAKQTQAATSQTAANTSAVNAAASELAAANSAGVAIWVSGTTYAIGNARFSPLNYLTYRRKTAGAGTTDPSQDPTNWQLLTSDSIGTKNRIMNGAMNISQRYPTGGGVLVQSDNTHVLDRWLIRSTSASKISIQQSAVAPLGFTYSQAAVSQSNYSILSSDIFAIQQMIEPRNFDDFLWGTSSARSVTLSFWVKTSASPGIFGGSILSVNRSYPFSYTIVASNVWEYKTITITGDTNTNWLTAQKLIISLGLGVGSTYSGTPGAWGSLTYFSATGATSILATSGLNFNITGLQLELASSATPFEQRPLGLELALCQRYCEVITTTSSTITPLYSVVLSQYGGTHFAITWYKQEKYSTPSVSLVFPNTWSNSTPSISANKTHCTFSSASPFSINGASGTDTPVLIINSEIYF